MNKKIISIGIISLFLLTTITSVSSLELPKQNEKLNENAAPELEIISFPTSAHENEIIEFKIHYSDVNNQLPPTWIILVVDDEPNPVKSFEKVDGSGSDYDADYIYTSEEYEFEIGVHTYYVNCVVDKDPSTPGRDGYFLELPDSDEQITLEILNEKSKEMSNLLSRMLDYFPLLQKLVRQL